MAQLTDQLNLYIPAHGEENWDEIDKFHGFLKALDSMWGRSFYLHTPLSVPADVLNWRINGVKQGWILPVDEVANVPSGSESGNDGWRVLIDGIGYGVFGGHDDEVATWDDSGSSWSFEDVKIDGNQVLNLATGGSLYYDSEWKDTLGETSFDLTGTETFAAPDNGVRTVSFGTPQPDTSYKVFVTGDSIGSFFVTNKTVGGFDINAQSSAWTGNADWTLTRKDPTGQHDKAGTEALGALDAGVKSVTFPTSFADANYRVILTPSALGSFFYTNKTASGFTINAQSSSYVGDVDWIAKHS